MDYSSIVNGLASGDASCWQQLHGLLWQDYNHMLAGLDKAEADKLFNEAFQSTASGINAQTNPNTIGDTFRRNLEWVLSSAKGANNNAASESAPYGSFDPYNQNAGAPHGGMPQGGMPQGGMMYENQNVNPYQYNQDTPVKVSAPNKSKAPLIVGIIAGSVVAIGLVIALIFMLKGGKYEKDGYEKMIDDYFKCYSDQDMDGMIDFYPDEVGEQVWDYSLSYMGYSNESAFWDALNAFYGKGFTITPKITNAEELDSSTRRGYEIGFNTKYDVDYDLECIYKLDVDEEINGSLYSTTVNEVIYVGVIDGEWYILGALY